jgi:hypothetical protein
MVRVEARVGLGFGAGDGEAGATTRGDGRVVPAREGAGVGTLAGEGEGATGDDGGNGTAAGDSATIPAGATPGTSCAPAGPEVLV